MRWGRRRYEAPKLVPMIDPEEPWLDLPFVVNDKPTTLRIIRKFAEDMSEKDYRNPAEQGLAMTIVALVDEVSWLRSQLADMARDRHEPVE